MKQSFLDDPDLATKFPNLVASEIAITSDVDLSYNCIAWAAGDANRWWWPNLYGRHWPDSAQTQSDLEAFLTTFGRRGFQVCLNGDLESGYEKVAIYTNERGEPQHMARQTARGAWTSKMGEFEDIEHQLGSLEGGDYGWVTHFLRRPASSALRSAPTP